MLSYRYSLPKHPGLPEIPELPAASQSHSNSRTPQVSPAEGKWSLAHFSSHSCDVIPTKLNTQELEMCFMLFVIPADSRYIYIYINKKPTSLYTKIYLYLKHLKELLRCKTREMLMAVEAVRDLALLSLKKCCFCGCSSCSAASPAQLHHLPSSPQPPALASLTSFKFQRFLSNVLSKSFPPLIPSFQSHEKY